MNITYRNINYNSDTDCQLLAKWVNDPEIRYCFNRFPDEDSIKNLATPEDFKKRVNSPPIDRPNRQVFILSDNILIGYADYEFDPPQCEIREPNTAWLSILIGEKDYQGKGLSKIIMRDIEQMSIQDGAVRFEIGVFEFNTKALELYKKIGYKEFKRHSSFTFWDGKMWDDIRMVKEVAQPT